MPELSVGFVLLVASASIFGPLSGWLAAQRGRNPVLWALFGIALGPIAAGLLVTAPPGRCAACRWPVAGWSARCVACGADVRTGATGASVAELIQQPAAVPAVGAAAGSVAPSPAGTAPSRSGGRRSGSSAGGEPRSSRAAASRSASRAKAASTDVADGSSSAPSAPPATLPATPSSPPPPLRPVEAPWSPRARATGLGHRPETAAPRHLSAVPFDPDPDPAGAIQILGSGVYMGGNRPIETGNRYLLGRVGAELQILGPVHLDAGRVADRLRIRDIEVFLLDGRLLIGSRDDRKDVTMAFVAVSLERGVDLDAIFGAPTHPASTSAGG